MEDLFDPITEFQVLETFDYQEDVQRPESLRFFTLEDQLQDYFESRIPPGRMTKYQTKELATELDRMRDAYVRTIELTDEDYTVRPRSKPRMPSWIRPLLVTPELTPYNYKTRWVPLYADQLTMPNYYPRMLAALPRPYSTTASDHPTITSTIAGQIDDDAKTLVTALGDYMRTKTVSHEDGTMAITDMPIPNTRDDVRTRGFVLGVRGVDIPNPLPDHPFLETQQPRTLETDEPFEDVYPSIDAILTHGVPTTTDPYGEGQKFLKVYDVKLGEIPWDVWKTRFPPVDTISEPPAPVSISFPSYDHTVPSENVQGSYTVPWAQGYETRYWLQQQDDAGKLIVKMLLSRSSTSGLLAVHPLGEVLEPQHPTSTPEECLATDNFDAFLNSGVFRGSKCIPLSTLQQERSNLIASGRLPWKDGTETEILSEYQRTLKSFQLKEPAQSFQTYESVPSREIPELRRNILTVLKDPRRLDEDKLNAIHALLKDVLPTESLYLNAEGSFLVCGHTLSVLRGDLAANMQAFYREWTGIDAGHRVCLHCGERVGQVFAQQDEFDDEGHLVVSHATLDRPAFHGETHVDTLTYSLRTLQSIFQMDVVSENVFYTLLSILQVLPTTEQLMSVLSVIRSISASLRKASKNAEFTNRTDGVLGFAGVVILIQGYLLTPRKGQVLALNGFPRDNTDTTKRGIVDTLLYTLKSTFEAFPASFRGSVAPFFRSVITKPKDIRKDVILNTQRIVDKQFKSLMESAREQYAQAGETVQSDVGPVVDDTLHEQRFFKPNNMAPDTTEVLSSHTGCPRTRPLVTLEPSKPPRVSQIPLELKPNLRPGSAAKSVNLPQVEVIQQRLPSDADVRKRIKLGFPNIKIPALKLFVENAADGYTLLAGLFRVIDVLALNATVPNTLLITTRTSLRALNILELQRSDLLRDAVRGLFYEMLHAISKLGNVIGITQQLQAALKNDIGLRMLMLVKTDAEKEQQALRASERETLKERLRRMDDTRRELTKLYLDMGISAHIVTPEDRELFVRNMKTTTEPEKDDPEIIDPSSVRDFVDGGDVPLTDAGVEMGVDFGDYGDRAVRDYDDYANAGGNMNDEEGYGT
jgi:hypothetical protein